MKWELFKHFFHDSYHAKMQPFIESEKCDEIYKFLKQSTGRGKKIAPLSNNVFRCFLETPLDELKVVMVGMAPYHTFKNNSPIADGLLMSCSVTNELQPSLQQFYSGLEKEYYDGMCLTCNKPADLSYLAKQGVLLFNASLTVEKDKPGSHISIWEPFVKHVFENILHTTGCPVVFLGKDAGKYQKLVAPFTYSFVISHPASASYKNTEWSTEGVFKKIDTILKNNNGYKINWLQNEN